ncbi:hypothetical protein [Gilvimarinus xylanilyticus]|uniref:Uncharacterized protein n=1 Tax=Gilvimarinus xylanilyticus TaxID=2944139 RepID=A0A9X2HYT8_9GAMM|nr:hypothetical protein [Gilvimarinus xylanilyticus]MCP8900550.1 hypothetical protein [Gilvimarinus xylanilyticus]
MSKYAQPSPRSTFVSVLAWIFIIGASFTLLVSVLQSLMVTLFFDRMNWQASAQGHPALVDFMLQNFRWIVYSFTLVALFTLISSIALLKRKNWARWAFVVILSLGILWQLAGFVLQFTMLEEFQQMSPVSPDEGVVRMQQAVQYFSLTFGLVIIALFAWLIKKLLSREIAAEFSLVT